jgi:type IV pilus assembly protein PilQ
MDNWRNVLLKAKIVCAFFLVFIFKQEAYGQQDRFQAIEQRLKDLSAQVPGLNLKTDLSVSNGSLQEFLRGLASANNLNLNIDPSLTQKISTYFTDEKVINILLFLAKQYNLDFTFVGTIITIIPYRDMLANQPPPPKELKIIYNSFTEHITMDLQDDTLLNIVKKITQLSNKNIVVLPELYNRKITEYIQDMTVERALEAP